MIDIREELEEANKDFINIHDFIVKVRSQVAGDLRLICRWILSKIAAADGNLPVSVYKVDFFYRMETHFNSYEDDLSFLELNLKEVISREKLPVEHISGLDDGLWVDDNFFDFGFSITELKPVFPNINLDKGKIKTSGWGEYAPPSPSASTNAVIDTPIEHSPAIEWGKRFAGRAAALDIIGAISKILVEKSGNKYLHGENVSANAIADSVVEMMDTINKNKSTENYRKLIGEALKISGLSTEE
ncbi:hypothetical protein SAMN05216522_11384 [Rosenbergiella nectarea]|uniref:Uncharacterized protein n=2 Tax=Rosenbergiella nectarea TaxID=988801 RepID=A0A1H9M4V2_9GAMM|nr:hypothetical protein SAMN05216522_11384 [Rosenbergiella nectarea]